MAINEDDISLDEVMLVIAEKMDLINDGLIHFAEQDAARLEENKKMRQVLRDVTKTFADINETYENIPVFLDGIASMFAENTINQAEIASLLHSIKDANRTIKHNMPSTKAAYLNLSQEELLQALAQLVSTAVEEPYETVFNQMVNWGAMVQQGENVNIRKELQKENRRHFWWVKFLMWANETFKIPTVTASIMQGMFTVFLCESSGERIIDHESMKTLMSIHRAALKEVRGLEVVKKPKERVKTDE